MAQTVIGMFDNASEAQQAVQQLLNSGFTQANIDVSSQSATSTENSGSVASRVEDKVEDTGDSIGRFFSNLFGGSDNDETKRYSNVARQSGSVVTVHAQSSEEAKTAADILDDAGAVDVDEKATQYGYASNTGTMSAATTDTGTMDTATTAGDMDSLKVIQENLQVGKKVVETGGARIRSRIVERPVEESVRLREERVRVERTPVDRLATDADLKNFQEGQIDLIEHAEVAVVAKEARVVEEISLSKETEERTETIRETLRNTEVDVEKIEGKDVRTGTTNTGTTSATDSEYTKP
ncbi:MAG: YsnF/AvaK domain-containing protein [Ferruginibacter sp.]|nr:YsnF/AvaK domain-containing protein [Cytophagales bacterium]